MAFDVKEAMHVAMGKGPDMTVASAGGYNLPEAGLAWARFVGYYDLGMHEEVKFGTQDERVDRRKISLVFELSGPNHPLYTDGGGNETPHRVKVEENFGTNEKSNFRKLFVKMNYKGAATHIIGLLGEAYIVTVFHRANKDGSRTFATLKNPDGSGYDIRSPLVQNAMTGKLETVPVPAPLSPLKLFDFDTATPEMWDDIYIAGEYPEKCDATTGEVLFPAKSKNVIQEKIRTAKNWPKCRIYGYAEGGGDVALATKETPVGAGGMPNDPLDDIPF